MPELLGAEGAEIRYAINGLLSLTCDGNPILGESRGQGPLDRRRGLDQGGPRRRPRGGRVDDRRPPRDRRPPQRHRAVLPAPDAPRAHPAAHHRGVHQDLRHRAPRPSSTSPTATSGSPRCTSPRPSSVRGSSRPSAGSARSGTSPTPTSSRSTATRVMPRENEWDARWWSPIVNAEHLRMREAAGVIDLTAFAIFDITGPGALDAVQRTCVSQCDVAVGKVIYTPVLDAKGGFRSDLTVMRLGDDHFRVVTGGAHGMADRKWFADQLPDDGSAHADRPAPTRSPRSALWGPRARDILASLTDDDVSDEGFGFLTCREIAVDGDTGARVADLLRRRARLGALRPDGRTPPRCGTSCSRPARRTARVRSASASTRRPAGSRRATARSATSSTASAASSRPACSGPRSRSRTSSAGTPTSRSARPRRRRCCAR